MYLQIHGKLESSEKNLRKSHLTNPYTRHATQIHVHKSRTLDPQPYRKLAVVGKSGITSLPTYLVSKHTHMCTLTMYCPRLRKHSRMFMCVHICVTYEGVCKHTYLLSYDGEDLSWRGVGRMGAREREGGKEVLLRSPKLVAESHTQPPTYVRICGRVVLCCFVFLLCCVALPFFLSISWMIKVMYIACICNYNKFIEIERKLYIYVHVHVCTCIYTICCYVLDINAQSTYGLYIYFT